MKKSHVVAKAILKNAAGDILLIRRSKTDPRRPLQWDFPGGFVEDDEDFVTAVSREIDEETDIKIKPQDLHLTHTATRMREPGNVCWLFFIGEAPETSIKLSFEHDKYQWVSLDKAIESVTYDVQHDALKHIREHQLLN